MILKTERFLKYAIPLESEGSETSPFKKANLTAKEILKI
jgi:hypothetical protein